jgi:hypothetical protein
MFGVRVVSDFLKNSRKFAHSREILYNAYEMLGRDNTPFSIASLASEGLDFGVNPTLTNILGCSGVSRFLKAVHQRAALLSFREQPSKTSSRLYSSQNSSSQNSFTQTQKLGIPIGFREIISHLSRKFMAVPFREALLVKTLPTYSITVAEELPEIIHFSQKTRELTHV